MAQPIIELRNDGDKVFDDFADGEWYTCEPGEKVKMPKAIAKHFIGNWEIPDVDDDREKELERVIRRRPKDDPPRLALLSEREPPKPREKKKRKRKTSTTILDQDVEPEFPGVEKLRAEAKAEKKAAKKEPVKEKHPPTKPVMNKEPATKAPTGKRSRLEEMAEN